MAFIAGRACVVSSGTYRRPPGPKTTNWHRPMRIGILTISDRSSRGERPDDSGPLIQEFAVTRLAAEVASAAVIADELSSIRQTLAAWCDQGDLDIIFTTGGTGFAPRDVTPEATRAVIEREAPGLAEAMRAASLQVTPHAMLSRAV